MAEAEVAPQPCSALRRSLERLVFDGATFTLHCLFREVSIHFNSTGSERHAHEAEFPACFEGRPLASPWKVMHLAQKTIQATGQFGQALRDLLTRTKCAVAEIVLAQTELGVCSSDFVRDASKCVNVHCGICS